MLAVVTSQEAAKGKILVEVRPVEAEWR